MNRRGFLRALTKIAVAVQAAPALATIERFSPVPVDMLDQAEAIGSLRSFDELLRAYFEPRLLEECLKDNWLLTALKKDQTWEGGTLALPEEVFGAEAECVDGERVVPVQGTPA